jgi:histone H3/H4
MREMVTADPDVKAVSKQALESLRSVAQLFAQSLLAKCADEARKRKRMTATLRDFVSVASQDEVLHAMLEQFLTTSHEPDANAGPEREPEADADPDAVEEDRDEVDDDAPSEIDAILQRESDSSD